MDLDNGKGMVYYCQPDIGPRIFEAFTLLTSEASLTSNKEDCRKRNFYHQKQ